MATPQLTLSGTPEQLAALFTSTQDALVKLHLVEGEVKTKKVDGEDLHASAFLIVGDASDPSTWNLPVHFSNAEKSKSHIQNAMSRFNQVQGPFDRKKVAGQLARLAKENGIDVKDFKKHLTDGGMDSVTLTEVFSEYDNGSGTLDTPTVHSTVVNATTRPIGKPTPDLHHFAWMLNC